MGLREQAVLDAQAFLEDENGFGWPIAVTNPDGVDAEMIGFSNDIATAIDPETGMAISGRTASVALSLRSLDDNALGIPRGIADSEKAPWVIQFDDILGNAHTFKVKEANPDRALGIVTCTLEAYKA